LAGKKGNRTTATTADADRLTMQIGKLDRRITVQREMVVGDDGYGNEIIDWGNLATVWARVIQQTGREFFALSAIQAETRVVFHLRFIEGMTTEDRVDYDGQLHDIHEVRELGRRAGLELHTIARRGDVATG
jgi:SPP1 family predicted phage head-tail adaptor